MDLKDWKLEGLILNKIKEFEIAHPKREVLINEGMATTPEKDGEEFRVIRYWLSESEKTKFYGILHNKYCHCGCGAGHSNLLVTFLTGQKELKKSIELVEIYLKDVFSAKRNFWYPLNREERLFEIFTGKAGNRRDGSWISLSEISGMQTPYNENTLLISELTKT